MLIEPPITFLPCLGSLAAELFAKIFTNERMGIQVPRRESLGSNLKNQHEYGLLRFDPMPSTPSSRMPARGFWSQISKQDTGHEPKAPQWKLERQNHRNDKEPQRHERSNSSHLPHRCRDLLLDFLLRQHLPDNRDEQIAAELPGRLLPPSLVRRLRESSASSCGKQNLAPWTFAGGCMASKVMMRTMVSTSATPGARKPVPSKETEPKPRSAALPCAMRNVRTRFVGCSESR